MQNHTTKESLFTTVLNKFHIVFQARVFSQALMNEYEDWREKHLLVTFKN